jgi:hypothetical protein
MRTCSIVGVLAVAVGLLAGCGSASKEAPPQAYPVTGEVLRGGKPAGNGTIQLVHQTEQGTRAVGEVGPDGKFTLSTITGNESRPGAVPGDYKAVVIFNPNELPLQPKTVFKIEPRENVIKVEVP